MCKVMFVWRLKVSFATLSSETADLR
jgi:hypothetical protein